MHNQRQIIPNIFLITATVLAVAAALSITLLRIGFTPVLSNSMSPTFSTGEIVITRPEPRSELTVGDVVVLPLPDSSRQRYLHRIVEIQSEGQQVLVRTQGDKNPRPDPWTLRVESQKVPVVVAGLPKLGLVNSFFQTPSVRLMVGSFIFLLALIGVVRALHDIRRHTHTHQHTN